MFLDVLKTKNILVKKIDISFLKLIFNIATQTTNEKLHNYSM